jgi:hypothetical protein
VNVATAGAIVLYELNCRSAAVPDVVSLMRPEAHEFNAKGALGRIPKAIDPVRGQRPLMQPPPRAKQNRVRRRRQAEPTNRQKIMAELALARSPRTPYRADIRRGRHDRSGDKCMTWQLDATALSALLDARETTPLQLLEQAFARLDALEPVLNAFTTWTATARQKRPRLPPSARRPAPAWVRWTGCPCR